MTQHTTPSAGPIAGLAAAALAFAGAVGGTAAAHGDAPAKATAQTISASGSGEVQVAPDRAWINMGAQQTRKDVAAAQAEVDATVQRFLDLTDSLGIDRKFVSTAGQSVSPNYSYVGEPRKRELQGYTVTRQLRVDLRDLDQMGPLLSRALKLGVNTSSGPQFDHTEREQYELEALAKATRAAKARAQAMAGALGLALGPVQHLQTGTHSSSPPQPQFRAMAADSSGGAEQSYETGQLTISASVTGSFGVQ